MRLDGRSGILVASFERETSRRGGNEHREQVGESPAQLAGTLFNLAVGQGFCRWYESVCSCCTSGSTGVRPLRRFAASVRSQVSTWLRRDPRGQSATHSSMQSLAERVIWLTDTSAIHNKIWRSAANCRESLTASEIHGYCGNTRVCHVRSNGKLVDLLSASRHVLTNCARHPHSPQHHRATKSRSCDATTERHLSGSSRIWRMDTKAPSNRKGAA
jgi:hypothetical protein